MNIVRITVLMKKYRKFTDTWPWVTVAALFIFPLITSFVMLEADLVETTETDQISPQHMMNNTYFTSALKPCFRECTKSVNKQLYTNSLSTQEVPSQTLS